ncbi:hypothetical protein [Methylomonas koyamae]|uniref:hypothetical protein n=1 Tax=Methylomonas koyamae TaxID=702114 RepID=UPI00287350A7|nr:hypothetical protein [Methylomonas koyamae]WNB74045.1 hypothetical protein RI210_12185 [Methylomonas koyamae]
MAVICALHFVQHILALMANYALRLPESLFAYVRQVVAEEEHVSMTPFFVAAIAECFLDDLHAVVDIVDDLGDAVTAVGRNW